MIVQTQRNNSLKLLNLMAKVTAHVRYVNTYRELEHFLVLITQLLTKLSCEPYPGSWSSGC